MRVTVILSVFVILSSVILMNAILQSYDQRTVSVRTAEIQNQCTILSNQLVNSDYLETGVSDVIDTELSQLSNIYNGRVLVIDDEFRIVEDTYDLEEGKTIISEDVVKCFRGEKPASYDRKSRYIEVAVPVKKGEEPVKGMILVSVSTDSLRDNVEALQTKARIATVAISIIGIFLSAIIGMLLVRPLKRMSQSIEEMAGGYGDNYLHENAYDETERISNAFNKLWDRYKVLDASREEFVANVSHELKTPLTSMKVLADSLLMQPDAPTEIYREFMGDLSEEIERENKIINGNRFTIDGAEVLIKHIGGYPGNYDPSIRGSILVRPPKLFISGHSHILKVKYDKTLDMLHINPGAAGISGFHKVRTMVRFIVDNGVFKDLEVIELAG